MQTHLLGIAGSVADGVHDSPEDEDGAEASGDVGVFETRQQHPIKQLSHLHIGNKRTKRA